MDDKSSALKLNEFEPNVSHGLTLKSGGHGVQVAAQQRSSRVCVEPQKQNEVSIIHPYGGQDASALD
jgi:hypothetical protein